MSYHSNTIIHIGLPKAASTTLQQLIFPNIDKFQYFSPYSEVGRSLEKLMFDGEYIKGDVSDQVKISIGGCNTPLLSREGLAFKGKEYKNRQRVNLDVTAARICAEFPNSKIIFLCRSQQDLIQSAWAQYIHRGGGLRFSDWLSDRADLYKVDTESYSFDLTVKIYQDMFGVENVTVIPFEWLKFQPTKFYECLFQFFNMPAGMVEKFKKYSEYAANRSLCPRSLELLRIWNKSFRKTPDNPSPIVGLVGASRHRAVFQELIDPIARRLPRLNTATNEKLAEKFGKNFTKANRELELVCNLDLSELGYFVDRGSKNSSL